MHVGGGRLRRHIRLSMLMALWVLLLRFDWRGIERYAGIHSHRTHMSVACSTILFGPTRTLEHESTESRRVDPRVAVAWVPNSLRNFKVDDVCGQVVHHDFRVSGLGACYRAIFIVSVDLFLDGV